MAYSPIVVFAYNRPEKLKNLLLSVSRCPEAANTEMFVFIDGAKTESNKARVSEVLNTALSIKDQQLFKSFDIICNPTNKGLALSIIDGVTQIINKYGRVIVLEDDLVVSTDFLDYMNRGLDFYEDNSKIGIISGYSYPLNQLISYKYDVYFLKKGDCWGWATWKNRWNNAIWKDIDFDAYFQDKRTRKAFERIENGLDIMMVNLYEKRNNSWAVRWCYYLFCNEYINVYPRESRVTNNGFDGSGTHSNKGESRFFTTLSTNDKPCHFITYTNDNQIDPTLSNACARFPRPVWYKYFLYRLYAIIRY